MIPIAVVCGGPSLEHDISLKSGREVVEHIDRTRFEPVPIVIEHDGTWRIGGRDPLEPAQAVLKLRSLGIDTCFLALHGPFGEDGRIQAFLETCNIRFTGSGPRATAIAGDKITAKRVAAGLGVRCAEDLLVPPATAEEIEEILGFPAIVKDPHQGSTLGMAIARARPELESTLLHLGRDCNRLLVERCVRGREFTVSVLDLPGEDATALPLAEIRAPDGWFDFKAKYSEEHGAEEICPANLEGPDADTMRSWALATHRVFGLRDFSRTDFMLPDTGGPVYLETNSIPGMTSRSLFPMACVAAEIPFPTLLTRLIDAARGR